MGKTYNIAVIPGDGTGPEVIAEGVKVLKTAAEIFGFGLNFKYCDFGGERYLRTGETLPDGAIEELGNEQDRTDGINAIFLGAIGHPDVKPGILEKGILLRLRFELDQYINLRPVKLYPGVYCPLKEKGPDDIDFVVIRENTGGLYTGHGGVTQKGTANEIASQIMIYDYSTVRRCLEYAFEYKRQRNKLNPAYAAKPIHLVHKTNVLEYCGDLWKRVFDELSKEYSDIKCEYAHVDAITMWFVKNPEWFDVVVTENMFGDIITDLGAMIQGGMGIAAGGNINPEGVSMFEPIGGSAPKYAGKNIINPLAAICAGAMMLRHLGEKEAGNAIEHAVMEMTGEGVIKNLAAGQMGMTTSEVGNFASAIVSGQR